MKTIKKISAATLATTMIGATILGAAAADLQDYPKPRFIGDDGTFNGVIVVGAQAAAEDVIGATNIIASLQLEAKKEIIETAEGTVVIEGEATKIATESNPLTVGEPLQDVKVSLDEDELPVLLANGEYIADGDDESKTYDYDQTIRFGPGNNAITTWLRTSDYELDEDNPHIMVFSEKGSKFLTYTLDFKENPESDLSNGDECGSTDELCDFEDTTIMMLGQEYDITRAELDGNDLILEMSSGMMTSTLYEGETITLTFDGAEYEVTVDVVGTGSGGNVVTILTVNGEPTKELQKDQTQKIAGIELGIKQIIENEAGEEGAGKDLVQFYLGAKALTITDPDVTDPGAYGEVEVNGDEIDGLRADVLMNIGSDDKKIQKIELVWEPEDDLIVTEQQDAVLPGLKSFKISMVEPIVNVYDTIRVEPSGDSIISVEMPFNGESESFDAYYDEDGDGKWDGLGGGDDERIHIATPAVVEEGHSILLTNVQEEESYLLEFDNINSDEVITFKDLKGNEHEASCDSYPCQVSIEDTTFTISAVDVGNDEINISAGLGNTVFSDSGAALILNPVSAGDVDAEVNITFVEEDENGKVLQGNQLVFTLGFDGGDASVEQIHDPGNALVIAPGESTPWHEFEDSDEFVAVTTYGSAVNHDRGADQEQVVIQYPDDELHLEVYVQNTAASVSAGKEETVRYESVPIPVSASKLDSEVGRVSAQNLIVVGGPCANTVAAELMGYPVECAEGFVKGKAKIKLFDTGDHVAMLVAGYSALDTRMASVALSNYGEYEFKGDEVEVVGTSLTDISVGTPTPVVLVDNETLE
jgi:hypothetical protein